MTNITYLADVRARRARDRERLPVNVIRIDDVAARITRQRQAMDRMLQEHSLGWHHTCPVAGVQGMILRGETCVWCDATDPTGPQGAA